MHRGYVKVSRADMDAPIWEQSPLFYKVWQYLRMKADWQTGIVKRSYRGIAQDVMWTERGAPRVPDPRTIREIVAWLVEQGMVKVHTQGTGNAQYTEITLCDCATSDASDVPQSNAASTHNLHTMSPLKEVQEVLESRVPPPPAHAHAHAREENPDFWFNPSHPWGFPEAGQLQDWARMLRRDDWERHLLASDSDFNAEALALEVFQAGKSLLWQLSADYAPRVYHYLHRHPAFRSGDQRLTMVELRRLNQVSLSGGPKGPFIREPLDYFGATRAHNGRYRFQATLLNDDGNYRADHNDLSMSPSRRETPTERAARIKAELRADHPKESHHA